MSGLGGNDIDREIEASDLTQITGGDEAHKADVNPKKELRVDDTPNSADSTTQTITTSATIANVSGTNRTDRKTVELQPLTGRINWGYDPSCPFLLLRRQNRVIRAGTGVNVYYKAVSGSEDVAVGEK